MSPPVMSAKRQVILQDMDPAAELHTRTDLHDWIHNRLSLPAGTEQALLDAIDQVLFHYERVWRESKDEAVRAVANGSAQLTTRMRDELNAREETSRNVTL